MRLPAYVVVGLVAMVAAPATADHCATYSTSVTDFPNGQHIVIPAHKSYLVTDVCQPDCAFAVFVYDESNGIPGLQRADVIVTDTCHDMILPDTLVNF